MWSPKAGLKTISLIFHFMGTGLQDRQQEHAWERHALGSLEDKAFPHWPSWNVQWLCLCPYSDVLGVAPKTVGRIRTVQFSSVAQSCPTLCDPMNRSTLGLPVHHQLLEFTQTHVRRVSDAIQPSHPLWKIPWRRKWQPTSVFLPGKSHGQRSLADYSPWGRKELDTAEPPHNSIWWKQKISQHKSFFFFKGTSNQVQL